MKSLVSVLVLACTLGACTEPSPTVAIPVFDLAPAAGVLENGVTHAGIPLAGDEEVPARATRARGTAVLHFSDDGTELSYQLIVANIANVVQAHIHIGAPGQNGPVGVFLYGVVASGGGRIQGVIAEGTLTADDFIGPLDGASMEDLRDHIRNGNAYVNVHTNDGVAPTNTGPGDFPGGEIRGAID
jgi:hypothetical protein